MDSSRKWCQCVLTPDDNDGSLASTFLTTLLCADGEIKATEESDACGMNLWSTPLLDVTPFPNLQKLIHSTFTDLESGEGWDKDLIAIVAGGKGAAADELERKLGPVQKDGGVSAGMIGNYFVERYGMRNGSSLPSISRFISAV